MAQFAINQSHIIGQGIVYFTLFYTTMNYVAYRRTREATEAAKKERDDRKKEREKKKENLGIKKTKDTL